MLQMIPHSQGKRASPAGGRIRSSCGYHHQRHQACHDNCDGRKNHPLTPHTPIRDKFSVGCAPCQSYYSEQPQDIPSPKRLAAPSPPLPYYSAPSSPEQQPPNLHSFNSKYEEYGIPPRSPPPQQKLATLAHEAEYAYQLDLVQKRQQFEHEEQLLLQYRQQLDKLRQDQEMEKQHIQQYQQVLDYQKQQQENELRRIQQYQRELEQYQSELDEARREQEVQRQIINKQQIDIAQSRADLRLLKKQEGLTSSAPAMFLPLIEKPHSPNPTTIASHALDEENSVHDRMGHATSSHKRSFSDIMGHDEEVSRKSNTRRTG